MKNYLKRTAMEKVEIFLHNCMQVILETTKNYIESKLKTNRN